MAVIDVIGNSSMEWIVVRSVPKCGLAGYGAGARRLTIADFRFWDIPAKAKVQQCRECKLQSSGKFNNLRSDESVH